MRAARRSVGVLAALFVLATAVPARAEIVVIDRARAHGPFATVQASARVQSPTKLWVTVRPRPRQEATVYWWVDCNRGQDTNDTSGTFRAMAPVTRVMRMPYDHPDECHVAVTASIDARGRLVVVLTARV